MRLIRQGSMEEAMTILKGGANPNLPSKLVDIFSPDGDFEVVTTPLHMAVESGELCLALHLLEAGARIDVVDIFGKMPLDYFVYNNNRAAQAVVIFLVHRAVLQSP